MERELKDKESAFYIYKKRKLDEEHHGDCKESTVKNSPITADDISWYLGNVWERTF